MLRRKKRRIAHGTDSADIAIDNKFQEERWSIFSELQRKWSKTSTKFDGDFHSVKKKEATRRVLSKRLPGIRLRTRILLKKVKETCLKFFSSKVICKRNNESGDSHNVKRAHHVAMSNVQAGCGWRFRSSTKLHHHQHQQHKHCHQHHHYYHDNHAIFPSLADEDAIADCIEFIKRSSSSSSSLSPSSSSSSSTSTLHGGVTN